MLMLHTGPWALALHVDWDDMGRWKHFCHLSWRASPSIGVGMNHFWINAWCKILTSCGWLTGQHMHKLQVTSVSLQSAVHKDYCVVLRSSIPLHPCICSYCTSAPSTCIAPSGQILGWVLTVWKYLRWWSDTLIYGNIWSSTFIDNIVHWLSLPLWNCSLCSPLLRVCCFHHARQSISISCPNKVHR